MKLNVFSNCILFLVLFLLFVLLTLWKQAYLDHNYLLAQISVAASVGF